MAPDYLVFGNGYLEQVRARSGKALLYSHALVKYKRRATDQEPALRRLFFCGFDLGFCCA